MNKLVIFDLDDTLLCADSEFHFTKFIVREGMLDKDFYLKKIKAFDLDYRSGNLNFKDYMRFLLYPLIGKNKKDVGELVSKFILLNKEILIDKLTFRLLEKHKHENVLIASGALDIIVQGFANLFEISEFLGTKTEFINDKVTGETIGEPNFDTGKLVNVKDWCKNKNLNLEEATFYTDSIHDLPLVEKCKNSIVVSPDEKLKEYAENNNLKIIYR
tara:strand:- start:3481 stop:4128 length:648 start_codon:yes stop_codon:yes gene_type:complete